MRLTHHCVLLLSTVLASHAMAQQPPREGDTVQSGATKRTILSIQDFPAGYQTIKVVAENAPGTCSGRHSHPGIETSYLIDGEVTFTIDGKQPTVYKPGGEWRLEPNVVHDACAGSAPTKVLVTYVLEKGKPVAMSASSAEGAKAMLAKTTAALKKDRDIAMAQMLKGEAGFVDGDIYPFCNRVSDGMSVVTPRYVPAGIDVRTLKDPDGKEYGKEIYSASTKPDGEITEVHYKAPKFGTLTPVLPKVSYVTKVGDMICGVGYYPTPTN
jgi:quercetin dioxygenase-like cupin family protein